MTGQVSSPATSNFTIIPLTQATNPAEVGHKAATLAALLNAGLPALDGVVVPARYTTGIPDLPDELVAALAGTVRGWGDVPVAVRSSGTAEDLPNASYAGLYTT
ncbi:MAG: phosphoenolpyruvate synthase, partial [Actinomycetota bacterium]|nr:phosphoenolpyruvate synthase [Actinomycetota bacterium]